MKDLFDVLKDTADVLCKELKLNYPDVDFNNLTYDLGFDKNLSFRIRIQLAIYIELVRAGVVPENVLAYYAYKQFEKE